MKYSVNTSIGYALSTTLNILRKHFNFAVAPYNLTSEQFAVMKLIDEFGPLTPTKIAELLERDKATITRIVNSLTKKGYIVKKNIDKRSFEIEMSFEGRENFKKANEVAIEFYKTLRKILNDDEYNNLINSLNKIKRYFKENR